MKLYPFLLRLFPRPFRRRFGDDMAEVFEDRRRAAARQGWFAVVSLWCRTTLDVATHAAAERRRAPSFRLRLRGLMYAMLEDLRNALRAHIRRPGLLALAAPMLAVGIGFNTALFAVVHEVILKPLPYADPDRVVMLWSGEGVGHVNSYMDYLDWKTQSHSFESLATYNISLATLADGGEPIEIGGAVVSPEFFHVLSGRILLGRGIEKGDELITPEQGRPIVLADSLWARRFNRDPHILGRTITLNNFPRRVVGILSPEFVHPEPSWDERAEYWSPLTITDQMRTKRGNHFLRVIGRLAPGVTLEQARLEMDGIGRALTKAFPSTNAHSVVVIPINDQLKGDSRTEAWLFLGAAVLVLTLGIANVVNLLLARANDRRAELAVRAALGAARGRLVWQLVADSTVVGLTGGLLGLGLAYVGIRLLLSYAPPDMTGPTGMPGLTNTNIDLATSLFAVLLSTLTGAACGILPAWRVGRAKLGSPVGHRGSSGLETSRARRWIVAAELALALPLVVGAGLLTHTLIDMERVKPGFDPTHALQFRLSVNGVRYNSDQATITFFTNLIDNLRAVPGVTNAGIVSSLPLGGLNDTSGNIVYDPPTGQQAEVGVGFRYATPGYFPALGIPLRRGRLFDLSTADRYSAVINDVAAARMWGEQDPVGRRIRFGAPDEPPDRQRWLTVVGVVGSLRHEDLKVEPDPEVFQPYEANPWNTMTVVLRGTGTPDSLGPGARTAVRALDPSVALVNMSPLVDVVDHQLAAPRFGVVASAVFGLLGLALATFGLFAVLSLSVAQRTREIGIRMALGATRPSVGRLLARESLTIILAGCTVGCGAAVLFARALETQLFGVTSHDAFSFAESVALLLGAALAAGLWPARRAMNVDPVTALRAD